LPWRYQNTEEQRLYGFTQYAMRRVLARSDLKEGGGELVTLPPGKLNLPRYSEGLTG